MASGAGGGGRGSQVLGPMWVCILAEWEVGEISSSGDLFTLSQNKRQSPQE